METNEVYATPNSNVEMINDQSNIAFFSVSIRKFVILFILTMGAYSLVWFYYNWVIVRDRLGEKVWPVARAIFAIFFTHRLFALIATEAKANNIAKSWDSGQQATIYVALVLISYILGQITDSEVIENSVVLGIMLIIGILITGITVLPFISVQRTINIMNADPKGEKNDRITLYNILWILVFSVFWLVVLLGLLLVVGIDVPIFSEFFYES